MVWWLQWMRSTAICLQNYQSLPLPQMNLQTRSNGCFSWLRSGVVFHAPHSQHLQISSVNRICLFFLAFSSHCLLYSHWFFFMWIWGIKWWSYCFDSLFLVFAEWGRFFVGSSRIAIFVYNIIKQSILTITLKCSLFSHSNWVRILQDRDCHHICRKCGVYFLNQYMHACMDFCSDVRRYHTF